MQPKIRRRKHDKNEVIKWTPVSTVINRKLYLVVICLLTSTSMTDINTLPVMDVAISRLLIANWCLFLFNSFGSFT